MSRWTTVGEAAAYKKGYIEGRADEKAERIILEWARKNPPMTNRMKFKEVFGFEFTDRVPESQYHREWLDAEYERK